MRRTWWRTCSPTWRPAVGMPEQVGDRLAEARSIAVVRANAMGDYLLTEPALAALARLHPLLGSCSSAATGTSAVSPGGRGRSMRWCWHHV